MSQELVRRAKAARSWLIKPEFHSLCQGTKLQIDSGWTGQVLSVSEGLFSRESRFRLVSVDKGLRSII